MGETRIDLDDTNNVIPSAVPTFYVGQSDRFFKQGSEMSKQPSSNWCEQPRKQILKQTRSSLGTFVSASVSGFSCHGLAKPISR